MAEESDEGGRLTVEHEMIVGALDAVKKVSAIQAETIKETDLLRDRDESVYLLCLLAWPALGKIKPFPIQLRYPFFDKTRVCLFVQDPKEKWKTLLQEANIPAVSKMLTVGKLQSMQEDVKWKQKLSNSYDLFISDAAAAHMLPGILGHHFVNKAKLPVEVRLGPLNFAKKINRALRCTYLRLPRGKDLQIKIGNMSMKVEELAENAKSVLHRLETFFAKPKALNKVHRVCVASRAARAIPPIPIFYHPDLKKLFVALTGDSRKSTTQDHVEAVADDSQKQRVKGEKRKGSSSIKRKIEAAEEKVKDSDEAKQEQHHPRGDDEEEMVATKAKVKKEKKAKRPVADGGLHGVTTTTAAAAAPASRPAKKKRRKADD